jgi:hypothetical protein
MGNLKLMLIALAMLQSRSTSKAFLKCYDNKID